MARTKKKGQRLGSALQSARAKHDTAQEEEILGKIAAKPRPAKKDPQIQQLKNVPGADVRSRIIDILTSHLKDGNARPVTLFARLKDKFNWRQILRATNELSQSEAAQFDEADLLARVKEIRAADTEAERVRLENGAARPAAEAEPSSGSSKAMIEKSQEDSIEDILASKLQDGESPVVEVLSRMSEEFGAKIVKKAAQSLKKGFNEEDLKERAQSLSKVEAKKSKKQIKKDAKKLKAREKMEKAIEEKQKRKNGDQEAIRRHQEIRETKKQKRKSKLDAKSQPVRLADADMSKFADAGAIEPTLVKTIKPRDGFSNEFWQDLAGSRAAAMVAAAGAS